MKALKLNRTHKPLLWLGIVLLIILSMAFSIVAKENETATDEKIIFLHLKADLSGITLVDHIIADGHLKINKLESRSHGLAYKAFTNSGEQFYNEITENPLVKKYEYEDPNNPGQILMKIVNLDEAEFWIRIPFLDNLDRLELKLEDNRLPDSNARPVAELKGIIDLSAIVSEVK